MLELKHKEITEKIISIFYNVYNTLGYGFLEKVYENSMMLEFESTGLKAENQKPVKVLYKDKLVGEYFADIVVEDKVILELKTAEKICKDHEYQLLNYLRATGIEVGLLLNFGKDPEFKRKVYEKQIIERG